MGLAIYRVSLIRLFATMKIKINSSSKQSDYNVLVIIDERKREIVIEDIVMELASYLIKKFTLREVFQKLEEQEQRQPITYYGRTLNTSK